MRKPSKKSPIRVSGQEFPGDSRGRDLILLHLYTLSDGLHDQNGKCAKLLQDVVCGPHRFECRQTSLSSSIDSTFGPKA